MTEVKCRKCGKVFIPAPQHVFRDTYGLYCSWTCYNHKDDRKKGGRKNKRVEMWSLEGGEVLKVFKNAEDAARETEYSAPEIREACRTGVTYRGFVWMYRE